MLGMGRGDRSSAQDRKGKAVDHQTTHYDPALEARLLAHRAVLAELIRRAAPDLRAGLLDWLEDRSIPRDGQEDPGAVPSEAQVSALATADEYRRLHERVSERLSAQKA